MKTILKTRYEKIIALFYSSKFLDIGKKHKTKFYKP